MNSLAQLNEGLNITKFHAPGINKISKIRFIKEQYEETFKFVSGSWNLGVNNIQLWQIKSEMIDNELAEMDSCKCIYSIPIVGDCTGLEFIDSNNLAVSSSTGFASLIYMNHGSLDSLKENYRFENLHDFSCTGLSVFEEDVATIGEDGVVNVLSANSQKVIGKIPKADSCSLTAVSFVSYKQLITGNRMGVLKSFDLKAGHKPSFTFSISCEDEKRSNAVTSICYHPTQKHILLGGSEEGSVTVWDLRKCDEPLNKSLFPSSYLSAHDFAITEMKFHQTQPTKMFTAAESGELCQWSQNTLQTIPTEFESQINSTESSMNPWLIGERIKNKISVKTILDGIRKSINTFDIDRSKLICASDNEAIYLIDNIS